MIRMFLKNEDGAFQILQAVIIYPICLFIIASFTIMSVYVAQKANLQSAVDMALIAYKNKYSDTFVDTKTGDSLNIHDNYSYYSKDTIKSPYRFLTIRFDNEAAKKYMKKAYDHVFVKGSDRINVSVETKNYIFNKDVFMVATLKIQPQINLKMMGLQLGPYTEVKASGMVRLIDGDTFVANIDFIADLVSTTKLGSKIKEFGSKVKDLYDKYLSK
jgi:hypothetical protein